ncbi:MAG: hypothetical protein LBV26_08750 [Bacteroidales bacterium]|jgi:hypothetical protein|nr:hypothetical protein [Bacteroidales bacterium]
MEPKTTHEVKTEMELEKFSSAFTLSDMEIFIFPELFFPLTIANIMSPVIWQWRNDPWFNDIEKKNFNNKVNRIKQYIIQNYVFNLDLDTWGLTTKQKETARFSPFFDINLLKQSNALFGYEGDRYYFNIDIRKHFGLDRYDAEIIPYWKTETVEAMTAFKYKEGFSTGAGECVSLSALYAAALFVVGRVPLENIFLLATPLHSQNFIVEKEGLITNNRRIVTKNMWFNGTSLSEKARRALENERVTIVSHISGHIHLLYEEASIDRDEYANFTRKLREFLTTDLTVHVFINFLRFKSKYKSLFQYRYSRGGSSKYITLEKMFEYEHTSRYSVSAETRDMLVEEIESEEFHLNPIHGKALLNDIEKIIASSRGKSLDEIRNEISSCAVDGSILNEMFSELGAFIHTDPQMPSPDKRYAATGRLNISPAHSREEIMDNIYKNAPVSEMAQLSLYVFRDMEYVDWRPFVKAAIERNPVCFPSLAGQDADSMYQIIQEMPDQSIYEGKRLALPDEVWNFKRGDGIEKALLMANAILHSGNRQITITIGNGQATLHDSGKNFVFNTSKGLSRIIEIHDGRIDVSQ